MIKIQLRCSEIEALYTFLKGCISNTAKTNDQIKEYMIASYIQQVMIRLHKKMDAIYISDNNQFGLVLTHKDVKAINKKHIIKISYPEVIGLYVFFNRYGMSPYLYPTRDQIYKAFQENTKLIDIVTPKPTHTLS